MPLNLPPRKTVRSRFPFPGSLRAAVLSAAVAVAGVAGVAVLHGTAPHARAEAPAAPGGAPAAAGDAKGFTDGIPGTDVKFEMLAIPGGRFTLGSPDKEKKRKADEGPQVEVEVEPFFMGKYEVTWAEYEPFLANYQRVAGGGGGAASIPADKVADVVTYPTPMYELEAGPEFERMGRGGKYPAVIMSPYAAKQYTKWLSKKTGRFYRLPTEAEWEYACRAGTKTAYSFGDDPGELENYGWFFDNSSVKKGDPQYHKVGEKKPNPWGLYDMHGNVAEYVVDQYAEDAYKKLAAAGKPVSWHDAIVWPTQQFPRIVRGGGWESDPEACRSAARFKVTVSQNARDPQLPKSPHWMANGFWIGFRVVSPAKEPTEAEKLKYWDVDDADTKRILEVDRLERQGREVVPAGKPAAAPK